MSEGLFFEREKQRRKERNRFIGYVIGVLTAVLIIVFAMRVYPAEPPKEDLQLKVLQYERGYIIERMKNLENEYGDLKQRRDVLEKEINGKTKKAEEKKQ